MPSEDNRIKILDAAEELFAENGFSATSIRAITSKAGVNLATHNYHFGSKNALVIDVFERRVGPLNKERLRLLSQAEAEGLTLEKVLAAFLGPAIRLARESGTGAEKFMKLMGRAHSESGGFRRAIIPKLFSEIFFRFERALRQVTPGLPPVELLWRIHFLVGAMAHTMAHALDLSHLEISRLSGSQLADSVIESGDETQSVEEILSRLIVFAAAGLRAEVSQVKEAGAQ